MSGTPYYRVDPEHSGELGREIRIFGPPGTGKTTFLSGSVKNTALMRGGHNVLVASFTVTAAAELKGRGLPLPKSQIGTLHSLAYRALDRPPVADEQMDDWNTHHPAYARTASRKANVDDGAPLEAGMGGATEGDALASTLDALRARRTPREEWPRDVVAFAEKWEDWKRANGLVDFTDMIEYAAQDVKVAPGAPDVGFFDEVQDFTPLELSLIRSWGQHMERVILAGDDDQAIYGFKGAEPDAFLKPDVPDSDKIVLSQSWRIPAAVHRAAEHWIRQVSHREEKRYDPREEEGAVRQIGASYQHTLQLTDAIEKALAETVTEPDGTTRPATVMLLASCGYMLDPVKHELRKRGVPFHNPYRTSRGDWNPMRPATKEGQVTSRERLLAYLLLDERDDVGLGDLARPWTGEDVRRWAAVVKKQGIFKRGAAAALEGLPGRELEYEEVAALFASDVELEQAVTPDLEWFERNLLASSRAGMAFPLQVARVRGARALTEEPRVVLGTIHSVKGGQADCSPPDEPVLTTNRGWVPIGELNPETDRLVSFNSDHHKIHRGGPRRPDGYAFTMGSREYAGPMLTLTTPASRTRVTPNHHLTVRWNEHAMAAHAVYLMRSGNRWRIGMTAMRHGSNGQSGPLMRGRREGADAVWLLSLHHSRVEAALAEQHLAWTFGVPDTTWRASRGQSQDQLDRFWGLLASQSEQGAKELLALHGQDAAWPMWDLTADVTRRQAGRRNRWQIRAANLMPRWMQLPTDPGRGQEPVWHDVEVTSEPYDGMVYSLDVERWHHYVSGGAIVHNCVFLIPDLSSRGANEWRQRGGPQDGVRRQMYVGMTRAKRELVLCAAATGLHVPPELMIEGAKR